jgi:hypothetical protein
MYHINTVFYREIHVPAVSKHLRITIDLFDNQQRTGASRYRTSLMIQAAYSGLPSPGFSKPER